MPTAVPSPTLLLDADAIAAAVKDLAAHISRRHPEALPAFVGIERRGVVLARRLLDELRATRGEARFGSLDVSLYRDDLAALTKIPQLRGSRLPFDVDGADIILVDDVLYTGRTIRAALEELMDFGRPARVELAVLLDRGCRELPVRADYAGRTIDTQPEDYVRVRLREVDDEEAAWLGHKEPPPVSPSA